MALCWMIHKNSHLFSIVIKLLYYIIKLAKYDREDIMTVWDIYIILLWYINIYILNAQ